MCIVNRVEQQVVEFPADISFKVTVFCFYFLVGCILIFIIISICNVCAVTWGQSVVNMMLSVNIHWNLLKLIRFHQMNVNIFKNIFIYVRYRIQIIQIKLFNKFWMIECYG